MNTAQTPFVKSFFADQPPVQAQQPQQQTVQQKVRYSFEPASKPAVKSKSLYDTLDSTPKHSNNTPIVKEKPPKDISRIVTVFGFPMDKATKVLQKLNPQSQVDSIFCDRWMHIEFQDHFYAQMALSQSGELMVDGYLVGVVAFKESLDAAAMSATPLSSRKKSRIADNPSVYQESPVPVTMQQDQYPLVFTPVQPQNLIREKPKMKQVGQRFDGQAQIPKYQPKQPQVEEQQNASLVGRLFDAVMGW